MSRSLPAIFCHDLVLMSVLVFATIVIAGCNSGPSGIPSDAVVVGPEENGTVVRLRSGQMLVVELSANPSTGFVWQLVREPNAQYLLVDGTKTRQSDAERANESQIETQYIRFVAQEAGETTLALNYVIPALGPGPETRKYTLEIEIE